MINKQFNRTISDINEKFNVVGIFDISPYFFNGGGWLWQLIKKQYRSVFENADRLVFYFDKDEHLYDDSPGKLISEFQKYLLEIDISNFFIILITGDKKIVNDADVVNKISPSNPNSIAVRLVDSVPCEYIPINKKSTPTICVHPWYQLHIGISGDILPCCDSDNSIPIGNITDSKLNDIINSDKFINIREKMLNGDRPIECSTCYNNEDNGIESKRNIINKKHHNDYINILDSKSKRMDIQRMDINLGNTCNFKCRMCTGFSSSRLNAEEKKLNPISETSYKYITKSTTDNKMSEILSSLSNLKSISFAGGEPLLMVGYNKILKRLVELGKSDVLVMYSSNLSILSKASMKYWGEFDNIVIFVSIDSEGEHAEYYRHGTVWGDIIKNYTNLMDNFKNIKLKIRSTLSIYNAFKIIPFQQKWIKEGLILPNDVKINIVDRPEYISIQVLPSVYKNKLIQMINEHIDFLSMYESSELIYQWNRVLDFLQVDNSHKLEIFFNHVDKLDTHRGEKFELINPEYIELRGHIGD